MNAIRVFLNDADVTSDLHNAPSRCIVAIGGGTANGCPAPAPQTDTRAGADADSILILPDPFR